MIKWWFIYIGIGRNFIQTYYDSYRNIKLWYCAHYETLCIYCRSIYIKIKFGALLLRRTMIHLYKTIIQYWWALSPRRTMIHLYKTMILYALSPRRTMIHLYKTIIQYWCALSRRRTIIHLYITIIQYWCAFHADAL